MSRLFLLGATNTAAPFVFSACTGGGGPPSTSVPTLAPTPTESASPAPTPTPSLTPTPTPNTDTNSHTQTQPDSYADSPAADRLFLSRDISSGTAPVLVQFSDSSQGAITSWQWDFGDGTSSTERNPAHEHIAAGPATVRLTVSGPGGTDIAVLPRGVVVSPGPLAAVEVNPDRINARVQDTIPLSVTAVDEFGNEIREVVFTWDRPG